MWFAIWGNIWSWPTFLYMLSILVKLLDWYMANNLVNIWVLDDSVPDSECFILASHYNDCASPNFNLEIQWICIWEGIKPTKPTEQGSMIGGLSGKASAPSEFGPSTTSVLEHHFDCLRWWSFFTCLVQKHLQEAGADHWSRHCCGTACAATLSLLKLDQRLSQW